MKKIVLAGAVVLWCLYCAGCSSLSPVAGTESGSQTTNGIAMGLVYRDGRTGADLFGTLRRQSYLTSLTQAGSLPDWSSRDVYTDSKGILRLDSLDTGDYMVEVNDQNGFAVAVRCTVSRKEKSEMDLGIKTLAPVSVLQGSVLLDPTNASSQYVQVYGLERIAPVDPQTGKFEIPDMPAGDHALRVISMTADSAPVVFSGVAVASGTKVTLPVAGARFSRAVYFNTTALGANVAGNVHKFPVCIRLTKENFNFSEARSDGGDIRFAKADNTLLPFEIERYDGASGLAEIWVTLDTLYGNSAAQFINMYWGNSVAEGRSHGAQVFSATNGFEGVWHLADNESNGRVTDAQGRNNGIMRSGSTEITTSGTHQVGIVGPGCGFKDAFKRWVDLGANKPFVTGRSEITISIWFNSAIDTVGYMPQLFNFSIGGPLAAVPKSRVSIGLSGNKIQINARAHDAGISHFYIDSTIIPRGTWCHVVGVLKIPENHIWLYVNGVLSLSTPNIFTGTATDPTLSTHSSIGANDVGTDRYFTGKLDEARIESRGRSADWIKLCYENQKRNDALVVFK